jgi:hypothetical protein
MKLWVLQWKAISKLGSLTNRSLIGFEGLPPAFMPVSCLAYSSSLKMEAICSSETSVDFQRTTRRYILQDSTLQRLWLVTGFPPQRPRFASRQSMWGLWWTKWHWGNFSLSTSVSHANHHSTNFSIMIISRGWHNRPIGGRSAEWTQLDSTPNYSN